MSRRCENCYHCRVKVKVKPWGTTLPDKIGTLKEYLGRRIVFGEVRCAKGLWTKGNDIQEFRYKKMRNMKEDVGRNLMAERCESYTT